MILCNYRKSVIILIFEVIQTHFYALLTAYLLKFKGLTLVYNIEKGYI